MSNEEQAQAQAEACESISIADTINSRLNRINADLFRIYDKLNKTQDKIFIKIIGGQNNKVNPDAPTDDSDFPSDDSVMGRLTLIENTISNMHRVTNSLCGLA